MTWSEKFSIGVPLIDSQHQALFNGIERIYNILSDHEADRDRRVTEDAIFFLEQHTIRHFADEEAYMRSISDANYALHKAQHAAIMTEIAQKKQEIISSNYAPRSVRQLLGALLSWLTYHTLEVDRLIGKQLSAVDHSNAIGLALENAITKVLSDMLQITPVLVDPEYTGAFYGNELFCCIKGDVSEHECFQLLFAADLQVIQQAVGKLFGVPVSETADLVESAFEELCRVLSIHFVKYYCKNAFLNIKSSVVVSSGQISKAVPSVAPVCSMLFNDPYGSFCIQVWESR